MKPIDWIERNYARVTSGEWTVADLAREFQARFGYVQRPNRVIHAYVNLVKGRWRNRLRDLTRDERLRKQYKDIEIDEID